MKHTPGPIEIYKSSLTGDWLLIANIRGMDEVVGWAITTKKVDAEANARLWAAAPDLLAACDNAVQALMLLPPDCLDDVAGQPSRDELINNIFGAIARARLE